MILLFYSYIYYLFYFILATDDGVLGGYGNLSFFDAKDSKNFIREFVEGKYGANKRLISPPQFETHLACGKYKHVFEI